MLVAVQGWQRLCVLQDKVARCLLRCRSARGPCGLAAPHMDLSTQALAAELLNARSWDPAEHPAWLAFEVIHGLEIRKRQHSVARKLLDQPGDKGSTPGEREPGALLQLNMGEGKTRVILPMLALELAGKSDAVRLVFLSELLHEAFSYLHRSLTGTNDASCMPIMLCIYAPSYMPVPMQVQIWLQIYTALRLTCRSHAPSKAYVRDRFSAGGLGAVQVSGYAGSLLDLRCLLQPFSRSIDLDANKIAAMEQQLLQCRSHRAVMCIASEERLSFELKAQVCIPAMSNRHHSRCGAALLELLLLSIPMT
jgi:Protein of unknown function (DUF3638)